MTRPDFCLQILWLSEGVNAQVLNIHPLTIVLESLLCGA